MLNELGHKHKKIQFYVVNIRVFRVTIEQFFMYILKYLSIKQFLLNLCLTFPAGMIITWL